MQGVATAIFSAFAGVSALHPKGFRGTKAWADGTSALREILVSKGWHTEDPQGQPRIVSNDLTLAITVSSGNPDTGNADAMPQTRNHKGDQTAKSVDYNSKQMLLFPELKPETPIVSIMNGQELWVLLYYVDVKNRQVRFELSKPTNMSETQKIDSWAMRLIMPSLSFGTDDFENPDDSDGEEIDIEITPKYL